MTIYLDIILLENIAMNYIILFTTGLIYKIKTKILQLIFSSLIGGIYAVLSFTSTFEIYQSLLLKIILSIAMIYIAFRPEKIKTLFRQLMLFYLVSFVFGGTAFALLYFVKPQDILMRDGILIGTYPIKIALLGGMIGFIVIHLAVKGIKNKINKKDMFCDVELKMEEKELNVKALIDTGNLLKEPITGFPVIIIENSELEKILPKQILDNTEKIINGDVNGIDDKYITKMRVIPFTSIGKQNGMLLGIKVEQVIIKTEEDIFRIKDVIVGMYNTRLTKNGMYNAIIGLDILEGGTNEFIANAKI